MALARCAARAVHGTARPHKSASTAFYRPLPDIGVSWKASEDDIAEARRSALSRNMRFRDDEADELRTLHNRLSELQKQVHALEAEQKDVGAAIPALAKQAKSDEAVAAALEAKRTRARELRAELRDASHTVSECNARSIEIRNAWPNRMHNRVPLGAESQSQIVALCDARAESAALPRVELPCTASALDAALADALPRSASDDHLQRADALPHGGVDMSAGITTTGPSWPYLIGTLSLLEHALTQYALATALRHGFTITSVPDVVKTDVAERCGFRPRDEASAQTYFVDTQRDEAGAALCLAGTAEIPLAAYVANHTYDATSHGAGGDVRTLPLPVKLAALGHAFRAEAGARGTDTRGLYRIHQFSKVEMFVVTDAASSDATLESLRGVQEEIAQGLGLLYRVLDMSSEELGASAYRKYDVEAWMPGRGSWGEICSASNCTDYQARRLAIKYRPAAKDGEKAKLQYAHTLNATAAAIPRLIVALLETYGGGKQLVLPTSLQRFWLGGDGDERVRWVSPKATNPAGRPSHARGLHTMRAVRPVEGVRPAESVRAPGPFSMPTRRLHASARTSKSFQEYKDELRARAARHGTDPTTIVVAFALLHELTAILPLFLLAPLFAALGVSESILDFLESFRTSLVSEDTQSALHAKLHEWIVRGTKVATKLCSRCDEYLATPSEAPNSPVALWLASLTSAYVVVKLLMPVRLAACVAMAPWTARRALGPLKRLVRRAH